MLLIHKNNYKHIYCRKYTSWLSVYISFPYLFLIGCTGSSLLHAGFLQQRQVRPTLLVAQVAAPLTMQSQLQEAWLQQLQHMGSGGVAPEVQGSVTVMHRLSCLTAYGIFLDQRLKLCSQGEESRWRRNRTGRSLSLLQIHQKNNRTVNKVYKTTSDRQQRTSGAQKSSPLSSKGGRTKLLKIKNGHKRTRDGDPSREGSLNRGSFQSPGNPRAGGSGGSFQISEGNLTGRRN